MAYLSTRGIIIGLCVCIMFIGCPSVCAQTSSHRDSISPLKPNPYLKHVEPWRWDIKSQVFLRSGIVSYRNGRYRFNLNGTWDLEEFEFVYPLIRDGGHYWTANKDITTMLRVDNHEYQPKPQVLFTPESRAEYVSWNVSINDDRVSLIHAIQVSHVVCADTVFDERLARDVPWPEQWPVTAERFLTPIIDSVGFPIQIEGQDELVRLVNIWLEGNDPKSVDQVTLAKYLTGKALEYVRITRSGLIFSPTVHIDSNVLAVGGFSTSPRSSWSGFIVRSADAVALNPAGSEFDQSTFLVSVLRAAGIPARTVLCYDNRGIIQNEDRIRVLVEFAMFDKPRDQTLWIPIDMARLRDNGRSSKFYEQPWDYFGSHDELHAMAPFSYYFHPPINFKAYGIPAIYGLKSIPDLGQRVSQVVSFDVMSSPIRADELLINKSP